MGPKKLSKGIFATILGAAIICSIISYQAISTQALSPGNVNYLNSLTTVLDCAYLVVTDGITTYAKNCDTGGIDFSGTNPSTVIQSAQNNMNSRQLLLIRGDFSISNPVNITKSINIKHDGKVTLTGTRPYMIFNSTNEAKNLKIYIGEVDGQDQSRDCIKVINGVGHSDMEFGVLQGCNHAIYFDSSLGSSASYGDINIYGDIELNNYGIFFDTPSGSNPHREGMVFHGVMFGNSHGVYISSGNTEAGGFVVSDDTTIDNVDAANSWDFEDYSQNNLAHTIVAKYIRWDTVISKTYFVPRVQGFNVNALNQAYGQEIHYPFSSIWNTATTGTAGSAPSYGPAHVQFSTAASTNSGRQIHSPNNFAINQPITFNYRLNVVNMTNSLVRTGLTSGVSSFVSSDNTQGVQVKWDGTSWKVVVSNGSTSQTLDTTLTSASSDNTITIHVIPNKAVTVWVRGTSTKVVQTTSGPLPNAGLTPFFNIQTTDNVSKTLALQQFPRMVALQL